MSRIERRGEKDLGIRKSDRQETTNVLQSGGFTLLRTPICSDDAAGPSGVFLEGTVSSGIVSGGDQG